MYLINIRGFYFVLNITHMKFIYNLMTELISHASINIIIVSIFP